MQDLPSSITSGTRWYHIAYTSSGKLYIDGIPQPSNSISGVGETKSLIGARWNDTKNQPENYFSGWIEEVRIWNKDLTQDQIRFMMNQHLQNAANMGVEIPMPVPGGLAYSDLAGYYRLISANPDILSGSPITYDAALMPQNGQTPDLATTPVPGVLHNMTTHQQNTAPLPYLSANDGKWTEINTWLRPLVWDIPNSTGIDGDPIEWNIVRTFNNISSDAKDITVLGLKSETVDKIITMAHPTGPMDETNSGQMMRVTHYLLLDGNMDLVGESQLLQDEGSILEENSGGWLERDQQGKRLSFNYNYWSSPVSAQGEANNVDYTVGEVLLDGTTSSSPGPIYFKDPYAAADGSRQSPIIISNYWIWKFKGTANTYSQWVWTGSELPLKTGEGYTMKGTDGSAGIDDKQNYVFRGKPHNGDFSLSIGQTQNYLIGNPYPSAINAYDFLKDNLKAFNGSHNAFNGTLYFWSHFDGRTHYLQQYIGGYAMLNMAGSVRAYSNDIRIDHSNPDRAGGENPSIFIPVGQAFFVNTVGVDTLQTSVIDAGDIYFKNSQRIYKREGIDTDDDGHNVIFHNQERKTAKPLVNNSTATSTTTAFAEDLRKKIWLKIRTPDGYHRQLLATADPSTTDGFDLGYDAPLIEDNAEDMYWYFNNNRFVIQGVPDFDPGRQLILGFKVAKAGELSIDIDELRNIPDDMNIYVADSLLGVTHDLRTGPYEIHSDEGTYTERLSIVFQDNTLVEPEPEEPEVGDFKIMYVNGTREIFIMNPHKLEIEKVYLNNMLGQQVHMFYDIPTKNLIKLPVSRFGSGVYVVKVYSEKGITTKKVILE